MKIFEEAGGTWWRSTASEMTGQRNENNINERSGYR